MRYHVTRVKKKLGARDYYTPCNIITDDLSVLRNLIAGEVGLTYKIIE